MARPKKELEAKIYIESVLAKIKRDKETPIPTLKKYAKDFYIWGKCSFLKFREAKGKPYQKVWANARRGQLNNYILKRFGDCTLDKINSIDVFN